MWSQSSPLSVLLGLMLWPLAAWSTTYYASPSGGDGCSTNAQSPSSASSAINCLGAGDTLYLQGGTYPMVVQGLPSGTGDSARVTLASAPGETAIIRPDFGGAGQGAIVEINAAYVTLDRLTVDGAVFCEDGTNNNVKLFENAHHVRIANSQLMNCRSFEPSSNPPGAGKGILTTTNSANNEILNTEITNNLGYGIYMNGANNLIEGCNIHDNGRFGIHIYDDDSSNVHDNTVRGNRIWNNGDNTNCGGGCIQSGMVMAGVGHLIYNNLIYSNKGGGIQMDASNVHIYNNTIYGNQNNACIFGNGDAEMRNNICANNSGDIAVGGTQSKNLTSNPGLANPEQGDFHLTAEASAAINQGDSVESVFTTDFDGTTRPQDGAWDIGAYEFGGSGGQTPPPPGGQASLPSPHHLRLLKTQPVQ